MKPIIQTNNGRYFDFTRPDAFVYDIEVIAHALSNICRFNGHCDSYYSVAQHSVFVSDLVPDDYALQALLHDAAEAFIGDIPTPLKQFLPTIKEIEEDIMEHVFRKYSIIPNVNSDDAVKNADLIALATEKRDLMPYSESEWSILDGIKPDPFALHPLPSDEAKELFLERYKEIV